MNVLPANSSLEEVQEFFKDDRFATGIGCRIVEATPKRTVCELDIQPEHLNAGGIVMGGATYTLGDFALGVACCLDGVMRVGAEGHIRYLAAAKGTKLIAECTPDKIGNRLSYYTVRISDNTGRQVAIVTGTTCARKPQ